MKDRLISISNHYPFKECINYVYSSLTLVSQIPYLGTIHVAVKERIVCRDGTTLIPEFG